MNYDLERTHHISYCGSYCHLCDWHTGAIRRTFNAARQLFDDLGLERVLPEGVDAEGFRRGLDSLTRSSICPGCKPEAPIHKPGEDRCRIRQCCYGKGLELCSQCNEFPCETLSTNPGVIKFHCVENLSRIKVDGIKDWIDGEWEKATRTL